MPTLSTTQLSRRFGAVTAVAGLDLAIAKGETFGLIGPDGAGKSTTLRMLAAVLRPSGGRAQVAGYDVERQAESLRRQIGYMPQHFSLYADLSVLENLQFFADIFGVRGQTRRQRIDRLLHFARLQQFSDRPAGKLSGGMKKKLALACALIHQPALLLLDEPTNGVDPVSRREFWDILGELRLDGVTILITTPYMDEAERCDRVGLLHHGRLIRQGAPVELRQLVPGHMLALHTPDLRPAAALAPTLPGYLSHQTYGDRLHLFFAAPPDPVAIARALADQGIRVQQALPDTPGLEQAFIHLMTTTSPQP